MNIAAVYIRVSTDSQTEYSPDAQLKAIKEYAKKNNFEIDPKYIFKDEGISGRKAEKRPAFMQMIATAKTKPKSPFKAILIHKFDRFARNREDSIVYKSLLKRECSVDVISITEDFGDDKFSVILEAMLEAMAEYYSLNLSDEVLKGMTEKANRGEVQAKAPFGYINNEKTFVIDQEKAKIVKMIFNDYENGIGFQNIAKKLNNMNIKTNRGNKWEVRTIEYILRNPVYKGYVLWTPGAKNSWKITNRLDKGIYKKSNFEPIIDESRFDKIQVTIEEKKKLYKHKSCGNSNFRWISKLVRCSNCNSTLTTQKAGLQCIGYCHGICEESHHVSYNKICPVILEQLKEDFSNPINIKFSVKNENETNKNEFDIITERIKQLDEKNIRCKNLYLEGIDTIEEYKQNKEEIQKEKELLENQLKTIKPIEETKSENFTLNAKNIYDIMINENIDEKIKFTAIHNIIDYIIYDKKAETIDIYYKI